MQKYKKYGYFLLSRTKYKAIVISISSIMLDLKIKETISFLTVSLIVDNQMITKLIFVFVEFMA